MKDNIKKLLQRQLTTERTNHATYAAFAAALGNIGSRPGMEKWLQEGAEAELKHAQEVTEYMQAREIKPEYETLPAISTLAGDDLEASFRAILALEQANTAKLNELYLTALSEGDPQTSIWVQPLVNEQTEDEKQIMDYLAQLRGLDRTGQFVFDHELL